LPRESRRPAEQRTASRRWRTCGVGSRRRGRGSSIPRVHTRLRRRVWGRAALRGSWQAPGLAGDRRHRHCRTPPPSTCCEVPSCRTRRRSSEHSTVSSLSGRPRRTPPSRRARAHAPASCCVSATSSLLEIEASSYPQRWGSPDPGPGPRPRPRPPALAAALALAAAPALALAPALAPAPALALAPVVALALAPALPPYAHTIALALVQALAPMSVKVWLAGAAGRARRLGSATADPTHPRPSSRLGARLVLGRPLLSGVSPRALRDISWQRHAVTTTRPKFGQPLALLFSRPVSCPSSYCAARCPTASAREPSVSRHVGELFHNNTDPPEPPTLLSRGEHKHSPKKTLRSSIRAEWPRWCDRFVVSARIQTISQLIFIPSYSSRTVRSQGELGQFSYFYHIFT
jgi:hypothetical protein